MVSDAWVIQHSAMNEVFDLLLLVDSTIVYEVRICNFNFIIARPYFTFLKPLTHIDFLRLTILNLEGNKIQNIEALPWIQTYYLEFISL